MKIHVKNLGILKQAEFSPGDITIICGENNTGKTYATYAYFGFLSFWREAFSVEIEGEKIEQLLANGIVHINLLSYLEKSQEILTKGCQEYTKQLANVFAASENRFKEAEFRIDLDSEAIQLKGQYHNQITSVNDIKFFSITKSKESNDLVVTLLVEKEKMEFPKDIISHFLNDAIKEILFNRFFPKPFIASAERTGAAIFRRELDFTRNRLLEEISKSDKNKNINPIKLFLKNYRDYALPVKNNVDFIRQLEKFAKQNSFIQEKHSDLLRDFADIIGGEYAVNRNDELYYIPKSSHVKLTMDESSSAVRSLLDVGFYLRHIAQSGDLLMVDEPELNLHPENQRRITRLFTRLLRLGIKVFITTHSDYIIKELNTLIMLNHDKPHLKRIMKQEGYKPEELVSADQIKVYIAEKALIKLEGSQKKTRCQTLISAKIDPEWGIEARSFDTTIETMNRIQEEIVWGDD